MTYYISITGLHVKSFWHLPKFFRYTLASKSQAQAAEGNIKVELQGPINGVYHTLTVWKDRKSMTRFMASGAHARAMKITKEVSAPEDTKVYGYESETIPSFKEAYKLWEVHGKLHGKPVPSAAKKQSTTEKSSGFTAKALLLGGIGALVVLSALYHASPTTVESVIGASA